MRACSLWLVGLGFRVRDKVRVNVRDRVGVRVSDGVRVSTFYFLSHYQPAKSRIPSRPHFTHSPNLERSHENDGETRASFVCKRCFTRR